MKPCFIDELPEFNYKVVVGDWEFECQTLTAGDQAEIARASRNMKSKMNNSNVNVEVEFLPEQTKLITIKKALKGWNAERPVNDSNINLIPSGILDDLFSKIQEHENKIKDSLSDKLKN